MNVLEFPIIFHEYQFIADHAQVQRAVFPSPIVLLINDDSPMAVLSSPETFRANADQPIAVLFCPDIFASSDHVPIAVL